MEKQDIKNILLANRYLTCCKLRGECSEKTDLARKYLSDKIKRALKSRKEKTPFSTFKAFLQVIFLVLIFFRLNVFYFYVFFNR
jgi:hypothetical protein